MIFSKERCPKCGNKTVAVDPDNIHADPFRVGYWLFVPLYFLVTVAGRKLHYNYGDGYNTGGIF